MTRNVIELNPDGPLSTLNEALDFCKRNSITGDTVIKVAPGEYRGGVKWDYFIGGTLRVEGNPSEDETPELGDLKLPLFRGEGSEIWFESKRKWHQVMRIEVVGLELRGFQYAMWLEHFDFTKIAGCSFYRIAIHEGFDNTGTLVLRNTSESTIQHNLFRENGRDHLHHALYFENHCNQNQIFRNWFSGMAGVVIRFENACNVNVVSENRFTLLSTDHAIDDYYQPDRGEVPGWETLFSGNYLDDGVKAGYVWRPVCASGNTQYVQRIRAIDNHGTVANDIICG
jgi:hypothetical protein